MLIKLIPGPFIFNEMALKGQGGEVSGPKEKWRLPARECSLCQDTEWHLGLARFDLDFSIDVMRKLFPKSLSYKLSFQDFGKLVGQFTSNPKLQKELLPGTHLGVPNFWLLTKPREFVWWVLIPLISERTLNCVRERGVHVNAVPVHVKGRSKTVPNYFHLIPVITNLMDENWLALEKSQCPFCKEWRKKPGIRLPKIVVDDKAQIVKSRWPENEGVVYSPDIGGTYYSPEFVQACRDAKLDGMGFTQVWWV
jgi:hypothetical protein